MLNILHDYFKEVSSEPYSFYPVEVWYQEVSANDLNQNGQY